MIKAGKDLKEWGAPFLHITCLCHLWHRVAEVIRNKFDRANKLIRDMMPRVFYSYMLSVNSLNMHFIIV